MSRPTTAMRIALPGWCAEFVAQVGSADTDEERMRVAIDLAHANVAAQTGGPFGAAVFDDRAGRLLAVGVNLVVPLTCSVLHAEVVALMLAEQAVGSFSLDLPDRPMALYTSCEPCAMCLGAIWWSGIRRVVCGASRADAMAIGFDEGPVFERSYEYLEAGGIRVTHDVLREEARAPLAQYAEQHGLVYNG